MPRNELSGLSRTVHGGQAWKLGGIEDFSQNLNPFGPPEFIDRIIESTLADLGHYPDDSCEELIDTVSKTFNIDQDCIVVGAGSSEIIRNVPNAFFRPGDKVLINVPSFAEYEQQCKIVGANICYNELTPENDFRIDLDSLMYSVDKDTKALYICNPNNPTGRIEPREKIVSIVRECEERGVLVFLDETLLELVPGYMDISLTSMVDKFTNLIVTTSLTKSFAIPGIRVGFGLSNPDIIAELDKVRMSWNVGQIEQTVANVLLRDHLDYIDHAAAVLGEESEIFNSSLRNIGFPAGPVSDSFFYFNDISSLDMTAAEFQKKMLNHGIMIRDCASFGPQYKSYIRYCVKDRERDCRFLAAVDSVING